MYASKSLNERRKVYKFKCAWCELKVKDKIFVKGKEITNFKINSFEKQKR